jgi:catechol 2,3-dioxygenase-like lactoylglutathione lyase family enzyme
MIATFGLSHIALAVRDPNESFEFYQAVFGMVAVYRDDTFVQAQTPGTRDVLVLEKSSAGQGTSGGIAHFGFRLRDPSDLRHAAAAVVAAGGTILSQGEFCPGEPYLFCTDRDGYRVEIWYELPTPADPKE